METLKTLLTVFFVLTAVIMTFFILLQEGKGGGLAGLGGTKAAGVEGVTNPIRRATAVLAAIFFVLAILIGALGKPESTQASKDGLFEEPAKPAPDMGEAKPGAEAKADVKAAPEAKPETKPDAKADAKPEAKADQPKADAPAGDAKKDAPAKK